MNKINAVRGSGGEETEGEVEKKKTYNIVIIDFIL